MPNTLVQELEKHGAAFIPVNRTCPRCHAPLFRVRPDIFAADTDQPMPNGICRECGYSERTQDIISGTGTVAGDSMLATARRQGALGYVRHNSLYTNPETKNCTLETFAADSPDQQRAVQSANELLEVLGTGKPVHAIYSGSPGAGKTHLAHGIMLAALNRSGYRMRVLFADWCNFIQLKKESMNANDRAMRDIRETINELYRADLVVLDDFGAERDTDYNREAANDFWNHRVDKSVIVTTNLTVDQLAARYGSRAMSRIKTHAHGFGLVMRGADMRAYA